MHGMYGINLFYQDEQLLFYRHRLYKSYKVNFSNVGNEPQQLSSCLDLAKRFARSKIDQNMQFFVIYFYNFKFPLPVTYF